MPNWFQCCSGFHWINFIVVFGLPTCRCPQNWTSHSSQCEKNSLYRVCTLYNRVLLVATRALFRRLSVRRLRPYLHDICIINLLRYLHEFQTEKTGDFTCLLVFVCAYRYLILWVHMDACSCEYMCVCPHMCGSQGLVLGVLSLKHPPYFLSQYV